jgi:hypothetical protein
VVKEQRQTQSAFGRSPLCILLTEIRKVRMVERSNAARRQGAHDLVLRPWKRTARVTPSSTRGPTPRGRLRRVPARRARYDAPRSRSREHYCSPWASSRTLASAVPSARRNEAVYVSQGASDRPARGPPLKGVRSTRIAPNREHAGRLLPSKPRSGERQKSPSMRHRLALPSPSRSVEPRSAHQGVVVRFVTAR